MNLSLMAQRAHHCIYLTVLLLAACATNSEKSSEALSLEEAVELSATAITEKLPARTRVAIVAFEAEHDNLAGYIMDKLTTALENESLEVADRDNLPSVLQELNFQVSGMVDNDSAAKIGQILGVVYVITGQLVHTGGTYRYRLAAVNVENAVQEVSKRYAVRNDRTTKKLVAALQSNKPDAHEANYTDTEETPKTAGTFLDPDLIVATQDNYKKAIVDYTEAIKLNPNNAAAYNNRGYAYNHTGDYNRAIADYTQAIKLTPNDAASYNNRGYAYHSIGDYNHAIADYTQAIKLAPNDATPYNSRGYAYTGIGDYDRAIADFNQAIKFQQNYTNAYNNRGSAYHNLGNYDRAIEDYTQVIKLDPNFMNIYAYRGLTYTSKGDFDHAIADFNQAIKFNPNDATAYISRGWAYYGKSDYNHAIEDFNQAIKFNPNDADAYASRGDAYNQKGKKNQAIQDMEKAISLNPNLTWAKNRLQEMRGR